MVRITGLKIRLEDDTGDLKGPLARYLNISPEDVLGVEPVRRSLDARKKSHLYFVYTVNADLAQSAGTSTAVTNNPAVTQAPGPEPSQAYFFKTSPSPRPVVVGMGPAGLFAALTLAASGAPPLILERGRDVDRRVKDTAAFWSGGPLDPESNVQFGEGGAGTFSDGKLTTRIDDSRVRRVIAALVEMGAPGEIAYNAKPHVGTDRLRSVIRNFRSRLMDMGAEIRFGAKLTGLEVRGGRLAAVFIGDERVEADRVILAPGNAARDTYEMLEAAGVALAGKPFAMGLRIEHPRELIDNIQFGPYAGHPKLGPADYMLTYQDKKTGRAAYSFCMCPGGLVIASSSEEGGVVVNGMSNYDRSVRCSNSALVVTVTPADFDGAGPLDGVRFQRRWEEAAYREGGGNYFAPAQDLESFLDGRPGGELGLSSYRPGVTPSDLRKCLPDFVHGVLSRAVGHFDSRMKGFKHPMAVLTGVETRTSSAVRILRGEDFQSVTVGGLYPCGEGSGYAGGIVSSAVDGIKAAEKLILGLSK